ncbi:MAG: prolipoprotein diacylglyceryl transferase, partial [Hyphomicrobium sp.]
AFPAIDPIAISFGPFAIKWYGLAYMAGLVLGWLYVKRLIADTRLWADGKPPLTEPATDDLLLWITIAIIAGGRLGQVLLYDPAYYAAYPEDILKIWKGGMSFHGALIGSGVAIVLFARHFKVSARSVMDLCSAAVPFGLFFGRIANFINSEHWGRESDFAYAVVFPNGGPLPRHASQLYEAALEGLVMFIILRVVTHTLFGLKRPGLVAGVFLAWYAIARTICEFFREPEAAHALNIGPLTAGQMYSLPMLLLGLYLIWSANAADTARKAPA